DRRRAGPAPAARGAVLHPVPLLPHPGAARPRAARAARPGGTMTYAGLALVAVVVAVVVALVAAGVRRLDARWWAATALTAVVLVALTVVFDSLMIAADLFRYDDGALLGVRLWLTPV